MLKTEIFAQYLQQYYRLKFHNNQNLKDLTWKICEWQQQRIKMIHPQLCSDSRYLIAKDYLFSHLYNFDQLTQLAQQFALVLEQKIKLDRWLPNDVLDALQHAFELAMLTLELDQQLAEQLLNQKMELNNHNMVSIYQHLDQHAAREKQLQLLHHLILKLDKFAHSYLLRSTFRIARHKLQQRGFAFIYHYLDDGFRVMRYHRTSKEFFILFSQHEQCFLDFMVNAKPDTLHIYYDINSKLIKYYD